MVSAAWHNLLQSLVADVSTLLPSVSSDGGVSGGAGIILNIYLCQAPSLNSEGCVRWDGRVTSVTRELWGPVLTLLYYHTTFHLVHTRRSPFRHSAGSIHPQFYYYRNISSHLSYLVSCYVL